jgi:hypothetical protein
VGVLSANALAVHNVSLRIHDLTHQHTVISASMSDEERMEDPAYGELRKSLMAAYAELAEIAQAIEDRQRIALQKRAQQAGD